MATIHELSDQLNYGKKRYSGERSSRLKDSVNYFVIQYTKTKKCPPARGWGDFKKHGIQQFVSEMAHEFLGNEGPKLWPENESAALYMESLVWPRDEKTLKDLIAKLFFMKILHKHKSGHQMVQKRKSENGGMPGTPSSLRNMTIDDDQTNPVQQPVLIMEDGGHNAHNTDVGVNSELQEGSDPLASDLDEEPNCRMLSPEEEAEVRALAEESFPTVSRTAQCSNEERSSIAGAEYSHRNIGSGRLLMERDHSHTDSRSSTGTLLGQEKWSSGGGETSADNSSLGGSHSITRKSTTRDENDRVRSTISPLYRREESPLLSESEGARQLDSSLSKTTDDISRSARVAVSSSTTASRAPPCAPEATMVDSDHLQVQRSIEMDKKQQAVEAAPDASPAALRATLEPEVWYNAITSREPKVTKSWASTAKFSDKTLAQFKKDLQRGFNNAALSGINCVLKGPNGRKAEVEIDNKNPNHLERLRNIFQINIREALEEVEDMPEATLVTFEIEIELVELDR